MTHSYNQESLPKKATQKCLVFWCMSMSGSVCSQKKYKAGQHASHPTSLSPIFPTSIVTTLMASFRIKKSHKRHLCLSSLAHRQASGSSLCSSLPRPARICKRRSTSKSTTECDSTVTGLASTFSNFLELPPELRIQIWRMALPRQRLVTIVSEFDRKSWTWNVRVETQPVQLLYVCQESRAEALREYTQLKFSNFKGACIYINWFHDTIFWDFPYVHGSEIDPSIGFLGTKFRIAQSLAIRPSSGLIWCPPDLLRQFSQLQKLMFVDDLHKACPRLGGNTRLILKELSPCVENFGLAGLLSSSIDEHPH